MIVRDAFTNEPIHIVPETVISRSKFNVSLNKRKVKHVIKLVTTDNIYLIRNE